jgi:glycosyltransferase involved in cell wall biosynthesis
METLRFVMTSTFYPPYHLGGDAVQVKYLADALVERGHEVHVMFSKDAYRLKRKGEPAHMDNGKIQTHALSSPFGKLTPMRTYAFGNSSFVLKQYAKLVGDVKPDVVHHHNISLLGHGLFRKHGGYRQLYTAHDYWLACQRNDLMRKGQLCKERRCKSCAISSGRPPQFWRSHLNTKELDCVICPSSFMQEQLKGTVNNTTVLPNFVPDPPATIAGSGNSDFYLFIGVMEPHKGVMELLEAFTHNKEKLLIIGNGGLANQISRRIRDENLSPRIQYLGWVKDKWPYIRDANAVLIPSLWPENCPLVALEAMSVGTPVICSDMGGTREFVEKLSNNLVIPADEIGERLANIGRPKLSREFIAGTFQANFSAEIYMKRYLEIVKGGCPAT